MLAKKHRLNLSLEKNSSIFQKGESSFFSSRFFLAYLRENDEFLKVACLSPKVIFSKATDRNHFRRMQYSLLEKQIEKNKFSLLKKNDLVIVIKRTFVKDENLLREDFSTLIEKINAKNL
jgi:ribonuclease P protein component